MLLRYRIGDHELEVPVKDSREAFAQMSALQEVFSPNCCGNCGARFGEKAQVLYGHRTSREGHDYYELSCSACGWRRRLGQRKSDGALFPREWEEPYQGGGGSDF